jgi:hypothetical protein
VTTEDAICPACGNPTDVHGCVTHDQAGTFCRAPGAPSARLRATAMGVAIVTHDPPATTRRSVTFPIPPSAPKKPCRSCGADVVWITTDRGRKMPVDPGTGESHFATCPQADQWRKERK